MIFSNLISRTKKPLGQGWYSATITALFSNQQDLWGIPEFWGATGGSATTLETYFPLEGVVRLVNEDPYLAAEIFALVVVTQPPPTAIPALTTPALIVFAILLAGAGSLIVRSRVSG